MAINRFGLQVLRQRHFVISIFKELGEHAAYALPDLVLLAKSDDSHAVASAEEILDSLHEQCSSAERGQRTQFRCSYSGRSCCEAWFRTSLFPM